MNAEEMKDLALIALDDLKAKDVTVLDVRPLTSMTDFLVIASGTSNRHVKALAENVVMELKEKGITAIGVEGEVGAEWVLADFGDIVVHVMLPETRAFYDLERLWTVPAKAPQE